MIGLPFVVKIFFEDENKKRRLISFDSIDESKKGCEVIKTRWSEYYIYQGCLNESLSHLSQCIPEPDDLCQEHGYCVLNSKHWSVFFDPTTGLLWFSEDREDEKSEIIKLSDYSIISRKNDDGKQEVAIYIK